jgi:hypothetical protein
MMHTEPFNMICETIEHILRIDKFTPGLKMIDSFELPHKLYC